MSSAARFQGRLWVGLAVLVLLVSVLLGRLTQVQVVAPAARGAGPTRVLEVPALRGEILAADGQVLVDNRATTTVTLSRTVLLNSKDGGRALLQRVAAALHQPYTVLLQRTTLCGTNGSAPAPKCFTGSAQAPIPLAQNVAPTTALALVQRPELYPGISVVDEPERWYPMSGGLNAAQVLGYLTRSSSTDVRDPGTSPLVGTSGLERQYETALSGRPGQQRVSIDGRGAVTGIASTTPATPGENLVTHLVPSIQLAAERSLARSIVADRKRGNPADNGAAVVLDVRTGAVLAAASYPTYDPRVWSGGISSAELAALEKPSAQAPLVDKVTAGTWAPASTFKVVSLPAAFALGGTKTRLYDCSPSFLVGDRVFHNDAGTPVGQITLRRAVTISCDTVFYRFAYQSWLAQGGLSNRNDAHDPFVRFAHQYGFGRPTGIDLPGEASGLVPDRAQQAASWAATRAVTCKAARTGYPQVTDKARRKYLTEVAKENCATGYLYQPGDEANFAIGQGSVAVTPLQLAVAYAAVANGGTLWTPHVGAALQTAEGRTVRRIAPRKAGSIGVSAGVLAYLRSALRQVLTKGTAANSFAGFPLKSYPIDAKTGTGEVLGKYSTAWFATFGPATMPRYAVVAVVAQGGSGNNGASQIARGIWDALIKLPH